MGYSGLNTDDTEMPMTQQVKKFFLFLFFALLFHAFLFLVRLDWKTQPAPSKVEIQKIDPEKLRAIKRQWKEKGLLLDRDKNRPKAEEPNDARYMSDKNIRVEKEQKARNTSPLARPGGEERKSTLTPQKPHQELSKSKPNAKSIPNLKQLGISFPFVKNDPEVAKTSEQARSPAQNDQAGTQAGGEQYLGDKDLPEGNQNLLNAKESVFYSFFARMYDAIGPVWQSKLSQYAGQPQIHEGDYSTLVDVVLDTDGNVIQVNIQKSSGIRVFDSVIEDSWKKVAKFPNPPQGLINEDHLIHTGWTFTVHVGQGLFMGPPRRNY